VVFQPTKTNNLLQSGYCYGLVLILNYILLLKDALAGESTLCCRAQYYQSSSGHSTIRGANNSTKLLLDQSTIVKYGTNSSCSNPTDKTTPQELQSGCVLLRILLIHTTKEGWCLTLYVSGRPIISL
jgi:hypothetical protein